MISDSDRDELTLLAIRHGFSGVGCEVRNVADRLLNSGVESDDLVTMYLAEPNDRDTIVPAFERFLGACNIRIPNRETAIWGILEHHVTRIANKSGDAFKQFRDLVDEVYDAYDFQSKSTEYYGDSHGLHNLFACYFGVDDVMERPHEVSCNDEYGAAAISELHNELVRAANTWLDEFGGRAKM